MYIFIYCISVLFFITIIFINIEIIFYYFLTKINITFFVIDVNILVFWFFSWVCFITYTLYIPFCIFILSIWIVPLITYNVFKIYNRFLFTLIYVHILAITLNICDFSISFIQISFGSWLEGVDIIYFIQQYIGSFFDFFFSFFLIIIINFIFIEKPKTMSYIVYPNTSTEIDKIKVKIQPFWQFFINIWCVRSFWFIFVFYFFCGESIMNDFCIMIYTSIFIEVFIITWRFFFFQKELN